MKPFGFAQAAALAAAVLAGALSLVLPGAASAQPAQHAPPQHPPPPMTAAQHTAGMAAAPAFIAASHLPCTLADARLIGTNGTGANMQTFYEVACTGNFGFVVSVKPAPQPLQAFTCVEMNASPSLPLHCTLPGNVNANAPLAAYIQKAGVPCTVGGVRSIGQTATNTLFELRCTEGMGYVLTMSAPPSPDNPVQMSPCLAFSESDARNCTLSDRASMLHGIDPIWAHAPNACPIRDRRYVLTTTTNANFYEIACQDPNAGFMMEVSPAGAFVRAIPCASADFVGGGCTLTNGRQAHNEQAGLYTTLATRAHFDCQVNQYAPLPGPPGQDIIEMKCSNRPDGAIGIFPTGAGATAEVIPCAHALVANYRCTFTSEAQQYPLLTADLHANGRPSCDVAGMHFIGTTADHKSYMEVSCADGLGGYMIEYARSPQIHVTQVLACNFAAGIGGGCTLPTNVAALHHAPAAPAAHH
jgi:hypothetical protein